MAMRFDQIGSQQNVQNVGEGEAYVYEKQKSPLLALGEQAMKTKLAEDKSKAKAVAAQKNEKLDLLKFDQSGISDLEDANKAMAYIQNNYNKSSGDPVGQQRTASGFNVLQNTLGSSRQYQEQIEKAQQKVRDLNSSGGEFAVSEKMFGGKLNSHLEKAKAESSRYANPLESLGAKVSYKNSVHPDAILNESLIATGKHIKTIADGLGEEVNQTVGGLSPVSGGYNEVDKRRISTVAKEKLDILVDNESRDPRVKNRYLDKLENDPNYGGKYFSEEKKDGFVETKFQNSDGKPLFLDQESFIKDKLSEDVASKLSQKDERFKTFYQDYGTKSFNFGIEGNRNSKYVVDEGGEVPISSTVYDRKGVTGVNVETYLPFTVSYADKTGSGKLPTINFANQYITDHSAGGGNKLPHRSVSRGNIEIQTLSPGITFNGKTSPVLQLPKNTPASVDAYYDLIKKQVDLGVFNKDTNLKVDVIGFGKMLKNAKDDSDYNGNPDEAVKELAANRLKKATTLSSLVLNKTSLNALNAGSNRIVSKDDFMNTDNAKMQQVAIDRIKKKYGWSTKTTGGSTAIGNEKKPPIPNPRKPR